MDFHKARKEVAGKPVGYHYLCNMRQKIGDWFLDVAKYILTAVLLSSMFSDMKNPFVFAGVICAFIIAFGIGYLSK